MNKKQEKTLEAIFEDPVRARAYDADPRYHSFLASIGLSHLARS